MSPRTRLLEIMSAAGLAKLQDEQALREGAASSANTGQWINALQSLVPAATGALDKYQGSVADDAKTAAEQLAAQHTGDIGDVYNTPGQEAQSVVDASEMLNPKKPSGIIDSLSSILGDREGAAAKAKAAAATKIASGIQTNRATVATNAQAEADKTATRALEQQKITATAGKLSNDDRQKWVPVAEDHPWAVPADIWAQLYPDGRPQPKGPAPKPMSLQDKVAQQTLIKLQRENADLANGKPPPAADVEKLSLKQEALSELDRLRQMKKGQETGPIVSRLKDVANIFFDMPEWTAFQGKGKRLAQTIGVALENGKLTDADIARYREMLANPNLDEKEWNAQLDEVQGEISRAIGAEKAGLGNAGFSTPPAPSGSDITPRGGAAPPSADLPKGAW